MVEMFGQAVPWYIFPIAAAGVFSLGMLIGIITKIVQVKRYLK